MDDWLLRRAGCEEVVARIARADGWLAKGLGVLPRRALPPHVGLWLPGVASIYTIGVRFSLDLLFLDSRFRAVRIVLSVPPGRFLVRAAGARHVVELGTGTLTEDDTVGETWEIKETESSAVKSREGKRK